MKFLIGRFNEYFPDDTFEFMTIYLADASDLGEDLKEEVDNLELHSIKKSIKVIEKYF